MIEAAIGFIGIIIGSAVVIAHEQISDARLRKRRSRYLATMAVSIVDEYISNCDEVIADAKMVLALQIGHTDVLFPSGPRFPNDLDWSFLDDGILYGMLTLANKTATAERAIDYIAQEVAHPPEYVDAFKAREERCEELKTIASDLAQQLRDTWGLPQRLDPTEAG